jgi:hypothetical protein
MAGGYPVGEEIAGYLSEKLDRYGAPLVLKRDNEGNINHRAINDVLSESFVLPLNNPEYYAPYNGAIEESQREVKRGLREKLVSGLSDCRDHVAAYAEAAVNDLNHRIQPQHLTPIPFLLPLYPATQVMGKDQQGERGNGGCPLPPG